MRSKRSDQELIWRKKFGDKIKRLIHIRGITQGQLARALGISDVALSRSITGARTPSSYIVARIADILNCDVNWLYNIDN